MPTPRLQPGEWGRIRTYKRTPGRWMAVCQFRDWKGTVSQRSRSGRTEAAAIRNLKDALTGKQREDVGPALDVKTPLRLVWAILLEEKRGKVASQQMSPGSIRTYEGHWRRDVEPVLGDLAVEWLTVRTADTFLKKLRAQKGYATTKGARSVLTEIADVAVRYELLDDNPVRKAADIPGSARKRVKALSAGEAVHIWQRLAQLAVTPAPAARNNRRYRATLCDPMVPDLWLWMLGTGDRISNALAARWPWIDMESGTARLGPNVIRVPGEGLRINEGTTKSREVEGVDLPEHVLTMLLSRQERADYDPMGLVFPDKFGDLLDPNNVSSKKLGPALDKIGYGHVSSHWCRRTLGSELSEAGMTLMEIAGRLRHADSRTTEKHYVEKRGGNPRVKAAIEAMLSTKPERKVVGLPGA